MSDIQSLSRQELEAGSGEMDSNGATGCRIFSQHTVSPSPVHPVVCDM
jgi:hypothetical protein